MKIKELKNHINTYKHHVKWETKIGKTYRKVLGYIGIFFIELGRKFLKSSLTHCTLCLREANHLGNISGKGFRCYDVTRECWDKD